MRIEGVSCMGAFGFGPEALRAAVLGEGDSSFAPRVDTAPLTKYFPARSLRQMDRFSRMALLGARLVLDDAGFSAVPDSCGVILTSGYGPATPTFEFLDSLLDFGEGMASPLAFSHSVNNIPAAIIAKTLGIAGPCATVCQFESPVAAGLLLARTWLAEGRVERVLFGAVDEVTPVLAGIVERLAPENGNSASLLADGAVFFLLSQREGQCKGAIESVAFSSGPCPVPFPAESETGGQLCFLSGKAPSGQRDTCGTAGGIRDGRRAYGIIPVAQAFDCAAALTLLAGTGNRALCAACEADAHSVVTLAGTRL